MQVQVDGSIKVWVVELKTDRACRGFEFTITGKKVESFQVSKLLIWYTIRSLSGVITEGGFLFPMFRTGGIPDWETRVLYNAA